MPSTPANEIPIEEPRVDVPKVRRCLRCGSTFHSQWAGERICPRCKSSNTWRNGSPLGSGASGAGNQAAIGFSTSYPFQLSSLHIQRLLRLFAQPVKLRLHLLYGALLLFVLQFELPYLSLPLQAVPLFQPFALLSGRPQLPPLLSVLPAFSRKLDPLGRVEL